MNFINPKTDLAGFDGSNPLEHFEVLRGVKSGWLPSPVEFTEQLEYVDIVVSPKSATINATKKTAYDSARQAAIDAKAQFEAGNAHREQRRNAYTEELGKGPARIAAGVPVDAIETIGDMLDALFRVVAVLKTKYPSINDPEFDAIVAKIQEIKGRFPAP